MGRLHPKRTGRRAPLEAPHTATSFAFLAQIGLAVEWRRGAAGFTDGVEIERGRLLVDPHCPVSNLLHEAGHIACVPSRFHHLLSGDLEDGYAAMFAQLRRLDPEPDSPLMRACLQCSDPEATAWAWAAGVHLGIPPAEIILEHQYEQTGALQRLSLQHRSYAGIHGLAHAGFCRTGRFGALPRFPAMAHWLQPA